MALIVEMVHTKEDRSEPGFFSCHRDTWKQLLMLAETFGRQPRPIIEHLIFELFQMEISTQKRLFTHLQNHSETVE
jgi:hypothetical protein